MSYKNIFLLALIAFIVAACMNNTQEEHTENTAEESMPEKPEVKTILIPEALIGSWKLDMPGTDEGVPDQLFRRIFEKGETGGGHYEMYWIASLPDNGPTVMTCEKGDLLINEDTIFMNTTAFGSEQKGPMSQEYYDTIRWYYPGDSLFDMFRNDPYGLFTIEGDTLFWKKDLNNDGKFIDQNEITRFLREK